MKQRNWNTVGVCGHIEIIDGSATDTFTPICKIHHAGHEQPEGAPTRLVAFAHAGLICYAGNDLAALVSAAKEAREALAACFRGAEKAGGYATESLMDEIAEVGVADGFGSRLQDAIARADMVLGTLASEEERWATPR